MYTNDLVHVDSSDSKVEEIWQKAQNLSIDEKTELVQKLLDQESGLIVISANTHLVDYIIAQMSLLSAEGLAYVWKAIAPRIASEKKKSRC
jgi:hypothetical protein